MALVAATAFFFMETQRVEGKWKTSLTVSGLVTLVAAVHYFYMRDVWVATQSTPLVYRYIDWLITVPLLMVEFYLILRAITNVSGGIFWRLMIGSIVMLAAGYMGEAGYINAKLGFIIGMAGWAIYPIGYFMGYFTGAEPDAAAASLNIIYNLADVVNKIAFGVIIWNVAVTETDKAKAS
jgi:bacteriorhodopsin